MKVLIRLNLMVARVEINSVVYTFRISDADQIGGVSTKKDAGILY